MGRVSGVHFECFNFDGKCRLHVEWFLLETLKKGVGVCVCGGAYNTNSSSKYSCTSFGRQFGEIVSVIFIINRKSTLQHRRPIDSDVSVEYDVCYSREVSFLNQSTCWVDSFADFKGRLIRWQP